MPDVLHHLPTTLIRLLNPDQRDRTCNKYLSFLHHRLVPSIREIGIRNPLTATKISEGSFQLLAGGTRLAAGLILNLPTVPVRLVEDLTPVDVLREQLQENEIRRNFTPLEKVDTWFAMLRLKPEWTQADLARFTRESPATINRAMKVKEILTPEELQLIRDGLVPFRSAYHVASAIPSESHRKEWMEKAKIMTADQIDLEMKKLKSKGRVKKSKALVLQIDGFTIKLPGDATMEAINGLKVKFGDLVVRAMKLNLPPSALTSLT